MLGHRLRRWPNIETTLGERLVFVLMLAGCQASVLFSQQRVFVPREAQRVCE